MTSKPEIESVKAIYQYLYDTFVDSRATEEQRRQVQERFARRSCLWDESTGKFWKPIDAFQDNVPFFGSRRVTIPFSHRTGEVYQLLGQRRSPGIDDYLDFLQELAEEYNSKPLSKEDANYSLQVLHRLESQLSLEGRSIQNIPVLTDDCQLCPANQVFIPDAPWRKDYIQRNRILHPQVSAKLAKSAGCLSLLRDVIERHAEVRTAVDTESWCKEWQKTLNSPEFISGLKRLIFHQHDLSPVIDITWIATASILPANQINVDLFLKDETPIASAIPGTYYFDDFKRIFHIICSGSRYIMLCYLAESLNNQMGEYAVQNLLPLASILDASPRKIKALLNELRIRALSGDDNSPISSTTPDSSLDAGAWAIGFYKWLGYTSISKENGTEGYYLHCTGVGLPEIQAEVKAINSNCPHTRIKENSWSKIKQLGPTYELLIVSHQGEIVDEIIQIGDIWNTLSYAESELRKGSNEALIKFDSDSDSPHNDLILNWHRLVESFHSEKIKRYRPIPTTDFGLVSFPDRAWERV